MSDAGRFVWEDLMTTDPEAAERFYTELLGWTVKTTAVEGFGDYRMIHRATADGGEEGLGGIVPLDAGHGIPSHWISYVGVDDVDAACERAKEAGGNVCVPPMDIPKVGRFAVVDDGTKAVISPFKSANHYAPEHEGAPPEGSFCWHQLLTTDVDKAKDFCAAVFGWHTAEVDLGPGGRHIVFRRGGKDEAGVMPMPPDAEASPHWLPYVAVADVDAVAERAAKLGGTVCCPPTDIPKVGRFTVLQDPTGAMFAAITVR